MSRVQPSIAADRRASTRRTRAKAWLWACGAILVAAGSCLAAERWPRPATARSERLTITDRAQLAAVLAEHASARAERCGCSSDVRATIENDLVFLFTGVEQRPGAASVPDWTLDPVASARCVRDVETALSSGCGAIALPATCDTDVLTRAPSPPLRVGAGEPCNYALCAKGLRCQGEEDSACVPGEYAHGVGACDPITLPPFLP